MHTSVYDASPPRGSDSSSAQTHHGAASAAQSPAGAAAHMEKGGASERTPAARELGTARVVMASDTSRKSKTTKQQCGPSGHRIRSDIFDGEIYLTDSVVIGFNIQ